MKEIGRRRATIVSILTVIGVFGSILGAMSAPGQRYLAPGALRGSHGAKQLACSDCHDAFLGAPDANCEKCHKKIARGRLKRYGSHAGMIGSCMGCHPSHTRFGEPDMRVDPNYVDHTRLRFSLKKHEKQTCEDCHEDRFTGFNAKAAGRCVGCHLNSGVRPIVQTGRGGVAWAADGESKAFVRHRRAVGRNCLKCHKGGKGADYKHIKPAKRFFVGKHAKAGCAGCHKGDKYDLKRGACANCHKQSHGPALADCKRCHRAAAWRPAKPDHAGKLQGVHTALKCVDCHPDNRWAGLNWACASCHPNPHNGGAVDDCQRCHDQSKWKPAKMDHAAATEACAACHKPLAAHAPGACGRCHSVRAWKPAKAAHTVKLGGKHLALSCSACHKNGQYSGLNWACASCHRGPHSNYGSNCAGCHTQSSWKGATFTHNGTSGDCSACHKAPGGHYSGGCSQCHKTPGSWGATLGNHPRVGEHSSTSFPCSYCHPSGYGGSDCTRCHKNGNPNDDD